MQKELSEPSFRQAFWPIHFEKQEIAPPGREEEIIKAISLTYLMFQPHTY